jgi:hypothetical protein
LFTKSSSRHDFDQRIYSVTHINTITMKTVAIAAVAGALATSVSGSATPVQKRDVTSITVKGNGAYLET